MEQAVLERELDEIRGRDSAAPPIRREPGDAKLFAVMRFVLVVTGLAIIYLDPNEPSSKEAITYGVLGLYCLYAAGVLALVLYTACIGNQRLLCALDLVFASVLMLWTQGTHSIFFYLLLFPTLVVSFTYGYREGLLFTVASVLALLVVGSLADPPIFYSQVDPALIRRPVYLLAFGYMVAKWGGREIVFKRRLMLLRDVNTASARAPVDQLVALNLRRIREFHAAQGAVLVVRRQSEPGYVIYSGAASGAREMSEDSARTLLRFEENASVLYSKRRLGGAARCTGVGLDGKQERLPARQSADCAAVAGLLEARHFAAIPYGQSDGTCGHLFLTSRRRAFTPEDADFLLQFNAAVAKVVENLQLVDELISTAAEHERTAISRDIHDAAVQPYIGLRLALEALYRQSGASGLAPRILDLIDMANSTVRDLRGYTRGLLARGEIPGGSLRTAILMQADRHSRFHGLHISTYVDAESGELSGRFAAQLFFIVVEALSNVVKHTAARRAFVQVTSDANRVSICIGNECSPRVDQAVDFVPKSIKSRVETLGGSLEVRHSERGYTVVQATLPTQ